ncbi:hypothetical protein AI2795V1_1040 [Serratia marcescens]|uniref:hypothetical protein n=1 Tax=Serratia marcescens TaxID=615 RepID=UPI001D444BEA|nr:hypothetical protein [Serratia marcescens]CAE7748958.1 hypothetical protein AI2795V1_1040 [Serratia marcescens]CAH3556197.1 hypothetical protein AI2795V1_1040 [Serratia marcescens]
MTVQVEALTYEALKAKCDHLEQINAQTLLVKLTMADTIKALKERVNALAVENQAMSAALSLISGSYGLSPHIQSMCAVDTPTTDAALSAIEARGVEKLIKLKMEQLASMHPDTHAFGATAESLRAQINELQAFAANIREAK